jgi:hypothetical protein
MRLFIAFFLILSLIVPVLAAQDDNDTDPLLSRTCTDDEYDAIIETLTPMMITYDGLLEAVPEGDPQKTQLIAAHEALAYNYWTQIFPELPDCAEAFRQGTLLGTFFDRQVVLKSLAQIGSYHSDLGDTDITEAYSDLLFLERGTINDAAPDLLDALREERLLEAELSLLTCTQSETITAELLLGEVVTGYIALGDSVDEGFNQVDTSIALLEDYAVFAQEFYTEVYPDLPQCAEAREQGVQVGRLIDSTYIVLALTELATFEVTYNIPVTAELIIDATRTRTATLAEDLVRYLAPITRDASP